VEQFPPLVVARDGQPAATYLAGETEGCSNREIALEELLMLWLANVNPAFDTFDELFDDTELVERTAYGDVIAGLREFFDGQPGFGPEGLSLIAFLRAPAIASPDSLAGQLRYIRTRWGLVLTPFLDRLIVSLDVIHEEEVALWMRMHPTPGPPAAVHGPGLGAWKTSTSDSARTASGCAGRADGQDHVRLARPAIEAIRPPDPPPGRDSR